MCNNDCDKSGVETFLNTIHHGVHRAGSCWPVTLKPELVLRLHMSVCHNHHFALLTKSIVRKTDVKNPQQYCVLNLQIATHSVDTAAA